MKLRKVKAWKAISAQGKICVYTCETKAKLFAKGGIIKETFIHKEAS